jgi:hypothetical protein
LLFCRKGLENLWINGFQALGEISGMQVRIQEFFGKSIGGHFHPQEWVKSLIETMILRLF